MRVRYLVLLAAVAAIGAVVVWFGSPWSRPTASSDPRIDATPPGPVHAQLIVDARELEWPCSPGGCTFNLELQGPWAPWRSGLGRAELGGPMTLNQPPPLLVDGEYTLRAEVRVSGDVIYPGESGPRDLGVSTTCSTTFTIVPETTLAAVTLDFSTDFCAAGTTVAADPRDLTSLALTTTPDAVCGADVGGCDYYVTLSRPGSTWRSVIQTVKPPSQLLTNELVSMLSPGTYTLDAESHRRGPEREVGVGFQEDLGVFASCSGEFVVPAIPAPGTASIVDASVTFRGPACTVETEIRSSPISTGSPGIVAPVPTGSGS